MSYGPSIRLPCGYLIDCPVSLYSIAQLGCEMGLSVAFKHGGNFHRSYEPECVATEGSPGLFGCRFRPATIYDEIGVAARNIHCYTVIGFWQWGGSGADSAY